MKNLLEFGLLDKEKNSNNLLKVLMLQLKKKKKLQ